MKNLITLLLVVIATAFNAQTAENYIKLKGHIENANKSVTVRVFAQTDEPSIWKAVDKSVRKANYTVKLNPTVNYQVWFTDSQGYTKIMHHRRGTEGRWSLTLDIDFNSTYYCEVYQEGSNDYNLRIFNPSNEEISYNRDDY